MSASLAQGLDSLLKAHQADLRPLPAEPAASRFSRAAIIAALQRWNEVYGEPPKVFDWDPAWARRRGESWRADRFNDGDWPSVAMVRRQFGNFSKAVFAAGLRPRRSAARTLTRAVGRATADRHPGLDGAVRRAARHHGLGPGPGARRRPAVAAGPLLRG